MRKAAIALIVLGSCAAARAAQVPANWNGGSGSWTTPTNWSGGVVPNNGGGTTYVVNIDNGDAAASSVTLTGAGTTTVETLTIDAGDSLSVSNRTFSIGGPITLNGALTLGLNATINLSATPTIAGTGVVHLQGDQGTTLVAPAGGTLSIEPGVVVDATATLDTEYSSFIPSLGATNATLINKGTVSASNLNSLRISASTIDNEGTFQVSSGGVIVINSNFSLATIGTLVNNGGSFGIRQTLENTGQTLSTDRKRGWLLKGTIHGGTVETTGVGTVHVPYLDTGTLNGVVLNGTVTLSGSLTVTNGIAGTGTIQLDNPEAIEGSGNISIGTVPTGITIRGGLGNSFDNPNKGKITVTANQGVIRAQRSNIGDAAKLKVTGPLNNSGSLQVSDGAALVSLNSVTFAGNSHLLIDGGGELDITGNLDLSASEFLDVLPKTGGGAYVGYLIATYTGTRTGTFDSVTSGIFVSYAIPGEIHITGTPIPEPGSVGLLTAAGTLAWSRCRQRRRALRG